MRGEREKREDVRRSAERTKKTEKTELSWPARMKEAAKVSSPLKSDNLGGKACTLFFTNFPEYWETTKLWQEFRKIGTIVDAFVARKRNKLGRKFGFARFIRVLDIGKLTEALNNLWLNKFKLKANLAKYGRKEVKDMSTKMKIAVAGPSTMAGAKPATSRDDEGRRSYKEAVNGSTPLVKKHVNMEPKPEIESIQASPSPDSLERLDRSLFGEVRCLEILKNFQEFPTIESLNDVRIRYFGGLAVLLEFSSKIAAKNYLILAKNTWSKWFRALECWSPDMQPMKSFAYLNIVGLPPHAWVPNVFSDIGAMWGDIVIPEWCNEESHNREIWKVVILTQKFNIINDTVEVTINKTNYRIMVVEDFKESEKFGPNFPAHPQNLDEKEDDKLIDCDQSRCDENSDFEFDGDDLELDGEDNSEHPHVDVVLDAAIAGHYSDNSHSKGGSTIFWENKANRLKKVKRDLKMQKLHSPCNCRVKIKRNGDGCKHAVLFGNVTNNAIIVDRDEEGGSDSDILIKSSNTRNLKKEPTGKIKSRESLIAEEVLKLNEVGAAIGIDAHGYHDQMMEMATNMGEKRHRIQLPCIQETKSDNLRDFDANVLWGSNKNRWAASPSWGNSGGLISIWDPDFIEIERIESNRNTVTIIGKWKDLNQDMGVINVYAPHDDQGKQDLWNWISNLISNESERMWIVCGDFNEVRCPEERRGSSFHQRGAQNFNSFIENLGLIDLNLGGRSFTYVSPNGANSSRLDRFLVSPNCIPRWPNVSSIV
ncbi:hypothetical protein LXL04_017370 [Taraxacum kok-saghyz]